MSVLLEANAITVRRGRRVVLTDVSLALVAGRAIHLAGANGSGKTSLLRVLAGLAAPRAGAIARRGACAYVPERVALAPALRCAEWLGAMRGLRGLAPADWETALAAGGLDPAVLARACAQLSKGMLQRIALLEAVQAECPLLLLDEPFAGLDGDGRGWLAAEFADRAAAGAALLFTDHSGAAAGRLALDGTARLARGRLDFDGAATVASGQERAVLVRAAHPDRPRLERVVAERDVDDVLRGLLAAGWHVEEVRAA